MPRVLPSQLTDEQILAMLESEEVVEESAQIFDYSDDFVPFLAFYKITPGDTPVSKKLLYKLYKTYSKQPLDFLNFNVQAGTFLSKTQNHYKINMDIFAISKHIYEAEKTRDKTKNLGYQKHFQWFLTEREVTSGTTWIEGFILFFIYKDFCKQRRVNPKLGYVNFHKFLKLHFQFRRVKENRALFFRIDNKTATIFNGEELEKIRAARAKKTRRGEKKESEQSEEASPE